MMPPSGAAIVGDLARPRFPFNMRAVLLFVIPFVALAALIWVWLGPNDAEDFTPDTGAIPVVQTVRLPIVGFLAIGVYLVLRYQKRREARARTKRMRRKKS